MKRLIMSISDKGGVGKTLFLRLVAELHFLANTNLTLIDGDGAVGQLTQFYGAKTTPESESPPHDRRVVTFDFHGSSDERDQLVNLLESTGDVAVIDLPAASLTALRRLNDEIDVFHLFESLGTTVTFIAPLTPFYASLRDVSDTLELIGHSKQDSSLLAVVRNLYLGEPDDFTFWNTSKTRDRILALEYPVLDFPRLKTGILAILDRYDLPFMEAYTSTHLSVADRNRVHRWIEACIAEITPVQKVLGFPENLDLLDRYRSTLRLAAA